MNVTFKVVQIGINSFNCVEMLYFQRWVDTKTDIICMDFLIYENINNAQELIILVTVIFRGLSDNRG